jgi:metal-sulfur cluster biosynthetic enzyme
MGLPNPDEIRNVIRDNVFDPEIGLDVVNLGLVYDIDVDEKDGANAANITMTLTSPGCPVGPHIIGGIQQSVHKAFPELGEINVHVVWEPLWSPDMMTQEAKDLLGFF